MTSLLRKIPIISSFLPPEQPKALPPPPVTAKAPAPTIAPTIAPTPPVPPKITAAAEVDIAKEKKVAQVAAEEKRKKLRGQVGRRATIRTSPLGAQVPEASIARKTLLGR